MHLPGRHPSYNLSIYEDQGCLLAVAIYLTVWNIKLLNRNSKFMLRDFLDKLEYKKQCLFHNSNNFLVKKIVPAKQASVDDLRSS